jgi:hypothetical protein
LNKEYKNVKNIINSYLNTGRLDSSSKFKSGTNIIWNPTRVFPVELTQVQTELENFVRNSYKISEIDELVLFQKHFNVDFKQKYPYHIDIDSNIYNQTFFSKEASGKTTLILDSIINETNIDEFCRRFYIGRRSGSSKVKIKLDK